MMGCAKFGAVRGSLALRKRRRRCGGFELGRTRTSLARPRKFTYKFMYISGYLVGPWRHVATRVLYLQVSIVLLVATQGRTRTLV
jgi:hypothetical protein